MKVTSTQIEPISVKRLLEAYILPVLKVLGVVGLATAGLQLFNYLVPHNLEDLALLVYLAAVVVAATRWGRWPAILTAVTSGSASAFFFTEPTFSFRIADPRQMVDLLVFLLVALGTGNLAARLKRELDMSHAREREIRGLYEFSRRLAGGFTPADLISALQDYLSNTLAHPTVLIPPGPAVPGLSADAAIPDQVRGSALSMIATNAPDERTLVDARTGRLWLLRAVSSEAAAYGVIAVDLGSHAAEQVAENKDQVQKILAETSTRLSRLDVGTALDAARSRARSDALRTALIGNVSHELRSPLASILGSASVLDRVPAVKANDQMQGLVETVLEEAKRLDTDIQRLLDATRLAAGNVRAEHQQIDTANLINQAVARKRRQLANHDLRIDVPTDLPPVLADPTLIEQAIAQLLENASKYSPAGSPITIAARLDRQEVLVSVRDLGWGLTQAERGQIGQRAFRGQHREFVPGSGLGLWIAHCFTAANGGTLEAETEGLGRGTIVSIRLRVDQAATRELADVRR